MDNIKTLTLEEIENLFKKAIADKNGGQIRTFTYFKVDDKSGITTLVKGKQFKIVSDHTHSKYYEEPTRHIQTGETYIVDKSVKFNPKLNRYYVVVYPFASSVVPTITYYKDGKEISEAEALAILKPKKEDKLPSMKRLMADQIISIT